MKGEKNNRNSFAKIIPKMEYWNYRIYRYKDGGFGVHETWYDKTNNPVTWTQEPIIVANSVKELIHVLTMIRKDIKRNPEILEYKDEITEMKEK